MPNTSQNKAIHAGDAKRSTADGYMSKKTPKAWGFKSKKERDNYAAENPHAASHPYASGPKLKPKGAPAPYKPKK